MVFCADSLEEVIEPLNKGPYPSISLFLSFGNFKDIASPIEKKYYKGQHFHYPVELMLKLTVIKFYREIPFRKLKESLTQEDLECLFTCEELKTGVKIPSGKTVHHFLYYRLGKEGVIDLMQLLGKEIVHYLNKPDFTSEQKNLIVDSTPLEASRYSDANFNSHYKIFMSKAHIVSFCGYPLYMRYSNGNDNDAPFGRELIRHISEMKPEAKYFLADGGYDNKQMYADIVQLLHTTPIISFREDAVIDKYAEPDAIDRRINKLWKRGGDVSLPIEKKLEFLYNLNPISVASMLGIIASKLGILSVRRERDGDLGIYELKPQYVSMVTRLLTAH
ncbi:unnamed protein product [Cylicocyclus nassatus]|uniref:Transposase IS4-like domain-containing protein n=1 Tax=Cylicocyclus nassatus TaxID=53992 RepID=A0AA36GQT0_CYLNA|nr:unnamed protein product [Cylicocyclus nassatus]